MNCSGNKTTNLDKVQEIKQMTSICPRSFLLYSCHSSAWCLLMQMMFSQWKPLPNLTPFPSAREQVQHCGHRIHATHTCPCFAPMEKGGGDPNNQELSVLKLMKMFLRTDTHFDWFFKTSNVYMTWEVLTHSTYSLCNQKKQLQFLKG